MNNSSTILYILAYSLTPTLMMCVRKLFVLVYDIMLDVSILMFMSQSFSAFSPYYLEALCMTLY